MGESDKPTEVVGDWEQTPGPTLSERLEAIEADLKNAQHNVSVLWRDRERLKALQVAAGKSTADAIQATADAIKALGARLEALEEKKACEEGGKTG